MSKIKVGDWAAVYTQERIYGVTPAGTITDDDFFAVRRVAKAIEIKDSVVYFDEGVFSSDVYGTNLGVHIALCRRFKNQSKKRIAGIKMWSVKTGRWERRSKPRMELEALRKQYSSLRRQTDGS